MNYTEVCDSLAAAGLACSRRHVNKLVAGRKLRVTRLSPHYVTFDPAQVRAFIGRELRRRAERRAR